MTLQPECDPLILDLWEGDKYDDLQKLVDAGYPWCGLGLKTSEGLQFHADWFVTTWKKMLAIVPADRLARDFFLYAYHYMRADQDATKQAHLHLARVELGGGWGANAPWSMIDVESANNPLRIPKARLEDWVSTYAAVILAETGRAPTLYGNVYLAENGVTSTCGCDTLIVARYMPTLPVATYERIGWTWSADPNVEPPTLLGWQLAGTESDVQAAGYQHGTPIGKREDMTAIVVANGKQAALSWLAGHRGPLG